MGSERDQFSHLPTKYPTFATKDSTWLDGLIGTVNQMVFGPGSRRPVSVSSAFSFRSIL